MLSGFVNAEFTCVQKAAIAVGELHPFRSKHKVRKEKGAPFRSSGSERVKYYSCTAVYFLLFIFIYVYRHIYMRHVLAVALASLP